MKLHVLFIASFLALPSHGGGSTSSLPGTFVPFASTTSCPKLLPRDHPPASARDVRPDDFKVVMALGDSITAGFLAKASPDDLRNSVSPSYTSLSGDDSQVSFRARRDLKHLPIRLEEYRGVSYPIGNDPGAITVATILSHYSPSLTGVSTGHHPTVDCFGPRCTDRLAEDGLNAAISGSMAKSLVGQVQDYLIPAIEEMGVKREDWKYVNLGIGGNDVCAHCLSPNVTHPQVTGTPSEFAKFIKDAVELLRKHVPHVIVNIVGLLRVSPIYDRTVHNPYCTGVLRIPRLPFECCCAFLPGPAGDFTRRRMDRLGEAYDEAILSLIREWDAEDDPSFGATWQPGKVIDLANWPIEAFSPVDCFHPSEAGHQHVAAGFWNRMTLGVEDRSLPIVWEDEVMVRCLEEGDRMPIGMPRMYV